MFNKFGELASAQPRFKVPELPARMRDPKQECNCAHYLGDEEYAQMLVGMVLKCHKCKSPMWLDETFFITNSAFIRIFYGYGKKWLVMNSWFLSAYYSYLKEHPDVATAPQHG